MEKARPLTLQLAVFIIKYAFKYSYKYLYNQLNIILSLFSPQPNYSRNLKEITEIY
jgi:hypothetical protein